MNKFSFSIAILPLLFIIGCSIKEVRDGCPCRLLLDMTSVDMVDQSPVTLFVFSDEGFDFSTVIDNDDFKDTCVVDVPRTELKVTVWSGNKGYMDNDGLAIPFGQQCPPVYIHNAEIDADGEVVCDVVVMKKNYCLLNVSIDGIHEVNCMTIKGGIDGFDKSGNPHYGDFSVYAQNMMGALSSVSFYIPRQNGTPLYLDVTENDGKIRRFPLHDYISEFGYDWASKDLNDLNIVLNYTPVGVIVTIKDWDEELTIDVVI